MSSPRSRSGGKLDLDRVEPVQQVLPERRFVAELAPGQVGRRDDAHVDGHRHVGAHRHHLAPLQRGQELGLQLARDVADLVQEQGPARRRLEPPDAILVGAGVRALLVAEQLAGRQRLGDDAESDRHERSAGAARLAVDLAGDQLLAGPVLAQDQHVGLGRRRLGDDGEHPPHRLGVAEHGDLRPAGLRRQLAVLSPQPRGLEPAPAQRDRGVEGGDQLLVLPRLGHEIDRAQLHRLDRGVDRAVGGDRDHHRVGVQLEDAAQPGEPLAPAPFAGREVHVEQDGVELVLGEQGGQVGRPVGGHHLVEVALEQESGGDQHVVVVVHDEDALSHGSSLPCTIAYTECTDSDTRRQLDRAVGL